QRGFQAVQCYYLGLPGQLSLKECLIFTLLGFHRRELDLGDLEIVQSYLTVHFVDLRSSREPDHSVLGRLVRLAYQRKRCIGAHFVAFPSFHLWLVHRDRLVSARGFARPCLVNARLGLRLTGGTLGLGWSGWGRWVEGASGRGWRGCRWIGHGGWSRQGPRGKLEAWDVRVVDAGPRGHQAETAGVADDLAMMSEHARGEEEMRTAEAVCNE